MVRNSPILPARKPKNRWGWIALLSLALHLLGLLAIDPVLDAFRMDQDGLASRPVSIRVELPEPVLPPPEPQVDLQGQIAVSYTHLTLPTIYSV